MFMDDFQNMGGFDRMNRWALAFGTDSPEDLAQEAAIRLWQQQGNYSSARAAFATWAGLQLRSANNRIQKRIGEKVASGSMPIDDVPESACVSESAEESYLQQEAEADTAKQFAKVGGIVVHDGKTLADVANLMRTGMTWARIAESWGMSFGAFKTAMSRAYARARAA